MIFSASVFGATVFLTLQITSCFSDPYHNYGSHTMYKGWPDHLELHLHSEMSPPCPKMSSTPMPGLSPYPASFSSTLLLGNVLYIYCLPPLVECKFHKGKDLVYFVPRAVLAQRNSQYIYLLNKCMNKQLYLLSQSSQGKTHTMSQTLVYSAENVHFLIESFTAFIPEKNVSSIESSVSPSV